MKSLDQGIKNSAANASAGGMAVGATSLAPLSALPAELLSALLADPLLAAGVVNRTRVPRVSQTASARRQGQGSLWSYAQQAHVRWLCLTPAPSAARVGNAAKHTTSPELHTLQAQRAVGAGVGVGVGLGFGSGTRRRGLGKQQAAAQQQVEPRRLSQHIKCVLCTAVPSCNPKRTACLTEDGSRDSASQQRT